VPDIFFCSDHYLGHANIINFEDGRPEFSSVEEMNEYIIERHNSVVTKNDVVYMLGDVAWNSPSLQLVKRMNGNKTLIMGNHDKQTFKQYIGIFNQVNGVRYFGKGILPAIMTHIPVHPCQLQHRFKVCMHGHGHRYLVRHPSDIPDDRHINLSMEQINYTPINLDEINQRMRLL